ncbi:MAG: hypothetical protein LRY50_08960 [Geovibrio sp.]|nr:hypothetical protein [Geovibrio sp.]
MGHKVHPYGYRLGVNKPWVSVWFAGPVYNSNTVIMHRLEEGELVVDNKRFKQVDKPDVDFFIPLDYEELIEELAEVKGMSEEQCSERFGAFSLTMRDDDYDSYYYNEYLGVFKEG